MYKCTSVYTQTLQHSSLSLFPFVSFSLDASQTLLIHLQTGHTLETCRARETHALPLKMCPHNLPMTCCVCDCCCAASVLMMLLFFLLTPCKMAPCLLSFNYSIVLLSIHCLSCIPFNMSEIKLLTPSQTHTCRHSISVSPPPPCHLDRHTHLFLPSPSPPPPSTAPFITAPLPHLAEDDVTSSHRECNCNTSLDSVSLGRSFFCVTQVVTRRVSKTLSQLLVCESSLSHK